MSVLAQDASLSVFILSLIYSLMWPAVNKWSNPPLTWGYFIEVGKMVKTGREREGKNDLIKEKRGRGGQMVMVSGWELEAPPGHL